MITTIAIAGPPWLGTDVALLKTGSMHCTAWPDPHWHGCGKLGAWTWKRASGSGGKMCETSSPAALKQRTPSYSRTLIMWAEPSTETSQSCSGEGKLSPHLGCRREALSKLSVGMHWSPAQCRLSNIPLRVPSAIAS